jgi:hypothetical protein
MGSRQELRQAFTRTAILSNEKYRGVRLKLTENTLDILANNPEQEEAEETVPVEYSGDSLEIGFNVSYLLDVLAALRKFCRLEGEGFVDGAWLSAGASDDHGHHHVVESRAESQRSEGEEESA